MYFYSDTSPASNSNINVWKMNASRAYLRHYDNFLFLCFMAKNGTRIERSQAEKELLICKRKLSFWERHPNFEPEFVQREKERMNREWRQSSAA